MRWRRMQTQKKKAKKDEDSNNEVAHVRRSSCHESRAFWFWTWLPVRGDRYSRDPRLATVSRASYAYYDGSRQVR